MPKVKKKAFPMGYQKPEVESMPRTPAGQKQNVASTIRKSKAALKAGMKREVMRDYKPPIHGKKCKG